jgi:uncharacterized RDD family membrane protein YckC
VSTPSDPGSGQPDPWAAPPPDASGQGAPPPPPPAYPPAPPAYPPAPPAYPPAPPAYEQPPPAYGQPPPGYGQPPYGGPQPGYGQAPPPYGQPGAAPGYGYQPMPSYSYASWGKRVGAWFLDFFIPFVIAGICFRIFVGLGVILWLAAIVWTFYNLYQGGKTGSRWGQKIVGIRLLKEATGQPVGGGFAIGRAFVHILDGIPCYIGYLWPLWDAKKQTFADKIMGTVVVSA